MRRFQGLPLALALAACESETASTLVPMTLPREIQGLMAADFPADGRIHVQSRGRIVIKADTPVCSISTALPPDRAAGHFGINSSDLFKPLGQGSASESGGDRIVPAFRNTHCGRSDSVIINGEQSSNREGEPYRLVLTVWQGDPSRNGSYWAGGLERLATNYPAIAISSPFDVPGRSPSLLARDKFKDYKVGEYVNYDMRALSSRLASSLGGK